MKLHPKISIVLSCILAIALTVSPLMAQAQNHAAAPVTQQSAEATSTTSQAEMQDSTPPVVEENGNSVGTPVPAEWATVQSEEEFLKMTRTSTMMAGPATGQQQSQSDPPGKSKWIVLAALLVTGAVVGAILLFKGFGGDSEETVPTVISAGPPSVNAPN